MKAYCHLGNQEPGALKILQMARVPAVCLHFQKFSYISPTVPGHMSAAADHCRTVKSVIPFLFIYAAHTSNIWDKLCSNAADTYENSCSPAHGEDKHLVAETDLYAHPSKLA